MGVLNLEDRSPRPTKILHLSVVSVTVQVESCLCTISET